MSKYIDAKVPEGHFDTVAALRRGQLEISKENQNKEKERVGYIRGGSSGAIIGDDVYGTCHRKAHLRMLGISTPLEEEIELMTKQGEQNEEIWIAELKAAGYKVLHHDDFKLEMEIHGKQFKGSPDIGIVDPKTGKLLTGLENKNLSASSTAVKRNNELEPDSTHLVQTSTYSVLLAKKLGEPKPIPYQLAYSSRNIWQISSMAKKYVNILSKYDRDVEVRNFGKQFSLKPFHRIYYIDWNDEGEMKWITSDRKDWAQTPLKEEHIMFFFDVVANRIAETKDLGPRPTTKQLGIKKAGYSPCNYCDFAAVCEEYEDNYDAWLDHARLEAETLQEIRYGEEK